MSSVGSRDNNQVTLRFIISVFQTNLRRIKKQAALSFNCYRQLDAHFSRPLLKLPTHILTRKTTAGGYRFFSCALKGSKDDLLFTRNNQQSLYFWQSDAYRKTE